VKELRSISSIFRRNENGEYGQSALLYRDILCYPAKISSMDDYNDTVKNGSNNAKSVTFTRWKIVT